jgi:hypothetical protein
MRVSILLGATLLLVACGGDGSVDPLESPATALSGDEVQALGDAMVGASSMFFERRLDSGEWTIGLGGLALGGLGGLSDLGSGGLTISAEMSWPCETGVLEVKGSATATLDLQGGGVQAVSRAIMTPMGCRFTHTPMGDGVTMTGDPYVEVNGELSFGSLGGSALTGTMTGAVLWEAEDDRSGRCEIDLAFDWTSFNGNAVTGTVCGDAYVWQP